MRTRRGKVVAWYSVTLAVVVLAVCGFAFRDAIAEEWYIYRLNSGDEKEIEAAIDKLAEMGSVRAVPYILGAIKSGKHASSTPPSLSTWQRVFREGPSGTLILPTFAFVPSSILDIMVTLRDSKAEHVQLLLHSPHNVYIGALMTISDVHGSATAPYFARGLEHKDKWIRQFSAFCLGRLGPQAKMATPALRRALQDSDEDVARIALWSLNNIQAGKPIRVKIVSEDHWEYN